ncbi:carboxylesterase (biotin synthesis protein BioH) [Escherichia coli]|uniref:Carboxylesterase (Biotin synthesis protein BioH) n=1 Tax=Escherichia coli TaxID=562 RepID=A0A2X1MW07_ECOLX|nr:carboxylesterase (biotin synthesis protein BioH) [Escherichia coli]
MIFQRTVERFLALQTMGTETARQDARALKKTVLALPMPEVDVLNGGLEILKTVDLRQPLQNVSMPFFAIVWLSRRSGAAQSGADAG